MESLLQAIESSGPASLLRTSIWLYPLLNAAHILSIGGLVTTAILMDLRVLGFGRALPAEAVILHLRPVAIGALIAAIVTGAMLFSVQPLDYFANPAFRIKMLLLALASLNALLFTRFRLQAGWAGKPLALLSAVLWLCVLFSGRMIGFIE